jgi:hypothetical protein
MGAHKLCKKVTCDCINCRKQPSPTLVQYMADLSADQAMMSTSFKHTSMDLCGPYMVPVSKNTSENRWDVCLHVTPLMLFMNSATYVGHHHTSTVTVASILWGPPPT